MSLFPHHAGNQEVCDTALEFHKTFLYWSLVTFLSSVCFITSSWSASQILNIRAHLRFSYFFYLCIFLLVPLPGKFPQLCLLSLLLNFKMLAIFLYSKCFVLIFFGILYLLLSLPFCFSLSLYCAFPEFFVSFVFLQVGGLLQMTAHF